MVDSIANEVEISISLIPFMWVVWLIFLVIFTVFAILFYYHWIKFDWEDKKVRRSSWIFLIGGIFLLLASAISAFLL